MRIALISMPWALFNRPSIQLGALKSYIRQADQAIQVDTFHPYLEMAMQLGHRNYHRISTHSWAGEALFSGLLFPDRKKQAREVFYDSFKGKNSKKTLRYSFDEILQLLENQFEGWFADRKFQSYQLVGFSVCFSQLAASLFAARKLKQQVPELKVVFGGSTCAEDIGKSLLKVFSEIDYIVSGEGEQALLDLCHYRDGRKQRLGSYILALGREEAELDLSQPSSLPQKKKTITLDQLPVPDFDDYFSELKAIAKQGGHAFNPVLPLEFSRGCWWNRCAFCNRNCSPPIQSEGP